MQCNTQVPELYLRIVIFFCRTVGKAEQKSVSGVCFHLRDRFLEGQGGRTGVLLVLSHCPSCLQKIGSITKCDFFAFPLSFFLRMQTSNKIMSGSQWTTRYFIRIINSVNLLTWLLCWETFCVDVEC